MASHKAVAGELVHRCLNAATVAHILHLKTTSFAAHSALGEFYSQVVDIVDGFAESYMGVYGKIDAYPAAPGYSDGKDYKEGLALMAELRKWLVENRYSICPCPKESKTEVEDDDDSEDTELQNIVDEVVALIDRTAYKLKFLK